MSTTTLSAFVKSTIKFEVLNSKYEFDVYYDNSRLRTIQNELNHWLLETRIYSKRSFIDYVNKKYGGSMCLSQKEYDVLMDLVK